MQVGNVLLLGAGESGKSTLMKQMHLLYGNRKMLNEKLFVTWLGKNTVECTHTLLKLADDMQV